MRLAVGQAQFLKTEIQKYLPDAQVYLFGSRVDDSKKGGDIDVLILASRTLDWREKGRIRAAFWQVFGEQKLDLVSFTLQDESPFKKIALFDAAPL